MRVDPIILWVPGTSNHSINPAFANALPLSIDPILVKYEASWDLIESIPDGISSLRKIITSLHAKYPTRPIRIAGESQGALVISSLLMDGRYSKLVDRAVLLGNPGVAPMHFGPNSKYLEIDHMFDPVTFRWTDSTGLIPVVDRFMNGDLSSLKELAAIAVGNPAKTAIMGCFILRNIPIFRCLVPDTHNYSRDMPEAAEWLLG